MDVLGEGRFLRLVRDASGWEWVERNNATGVVVVAAKTPQDEILLIVQHRPPVGARVIELPAGLVGDGHATGEDGAVAARRELIEETGWDAQTMRLAFRGPSSAGLSGEILEIYVATGLRRVAAGGGVEGEAIETHCVALSDVDRWLSERMAEGVLVDPKVFMGVHLLENG